MRWHLDRKSAVGLGLALIILIGAEYLAYWRLQRLLETSRQVAHTREVLDALEKTLQVMEQTESSQRVYLLTGEDSYLQDYRAEIARIPEVLAGLRSLTFGQPAQQQELASLARLIESRKESLAKNIEIRKKKGTAAASKAILSGAGKQRMESVRSAIGQMENTENGRLQAQMEHWEAQARTMTGVLILALMLAFGFLILATLAINRQASGRLKTLERAEGELRRLNRALRTISECNQSIVYSREETELLQAVCRILVDEGGYLMAWVGYAEEDAVKSVRPAAFAGAETGYLKNANITWSQDAAGSGPTGMAIRTGELQVARNIQDDPLFAPWREEAARRGYASSVALPLNLEGKRLGALILYSARVDAFDTQEISLLSELANDIAHGVQSLRTRAERHQAEEQLQRASAYNRSLIEASLDPLVTIAPDGKITDVNAATEKATGRTRQELIGTDFCDYFTEPQQARAGYQQVFREGQVQDYPLEIRHMGGHITPVLYNATVYRDAEGEVIGVFAAARDITETKRAQRAVESERARFNGVLDRLPVYVVLLTPDYHVPFANRFFRERFGESQGLHCYEYLFNRTEPCEVCESFRVLETRAPHEWEWAGPDGRDYQVYDFPFADTDGAPLILEMGMDVTEQKRAAVALRAASAYNRSLIEASLDPLVTIAPDGKITDVNEATEKVTGRTRGELIGTDFCDYFTEPHKARSGYQQVFREGWAQDYELEIHHTDDHTTPVLYNATVYRDEEGKVIGVFAAARDITERKKAEAAVRESEASLRKAQAIAHVGSWNLEVATNVLSWSDEVFRIFGLQKRFALTYRDFLAMVHPEDREKVEQSCADALLGLPFDLEHRIVVGDRVKWVREMAVVELDEENRAVREMGTVQDVTERKRAEEEIRKLNEDLEERVTERTAELEATNKELEAFTYSVSHDLRAPLRHVDGFSQLLVEEYGAQLPEEVQRYLGRIQAGVRQMGRLVDDLLNLARIGRQEVRLQVTGLGSLAGQVVSELKLDIGERAIDWKIGPLPFVECDPALLKQVFANLLSNAVKYTRPRNPALIEVGAVPDSEHPTVFVRDNGVGFSMKYAHKLFGVFQRLHRAEDFEGTGIGLATVQRIIRKHGGRVWAEAELDKGATFYFTLGASGRELAVAPKKGETGDVAKQGNGNTVGGG